MIKVKKQTLIFLLGCFSFFTHMDLRAGDVDPSYLEVSKYDDYHSYIAKNFFDHKFNRQLREFNEAMETKERAQKLLSHCDDAALREAFSYEAFVYKCLNEDELKNYLKILDDSCKLGNEWRPRGYCWTLNYVLDFTHIGTAALSLTGFFLGGLWTGLKTPMGPYVLYVGAGIATETILYWIGRMSYFYFSEYPAIITLKDPEIQSLILEKAKLIAEDSKEKIEGSFTISLRENG